MARAKSRSTLRQQYEKRRALQAEIVDYIKAQTYALGPDDFIGRCWLMRTLYDAGASVSDLDGATKAEFLFWLDGRAFQVTVVRRPDNDEE